MLTPRRLALRLRETSSRKWVCQRCISQTQLRLSQPANEDERSGESFNSKVDANSPPIETWQMLKELKSEEVLSQEPRSGESGSPTDTFRRQWAQSSSPKKPPSVLGNFSLAQLAEAYQRNGISRQYVKGSTWVLKQEQLLEEEDQQKKKDQALDNIEEEISSTPELDDLSRLDEVETATSVDIFGGENMRDYQGVIPLNGEDYQQTKYPLKLGSFIETRGIVSSTGIVISTRYLESHRLFYYLNPRGRILLSKSSYVFFTIPDFFPPDAAARMGQIIGEADRYIPRRPDKSAEVLEADSEEFNDIRSSMIMRLREFGVESERSMNQVRQQNTSPHQLLKHEKHDRIASAFTPDVAKRLFHTDEPSIAELYATHKVLADDLIHFLPDPTRHVETATFVVHPTRDVMLVTQVSNWIRKFSPHVRSFLSKSAKLIKLSRSLPQPQSIATLEVELPTELHFNNNDRRIIQFITKYVTGRQHFIPNDIMALTPLLLKRSGMYPPEVIANPDRDAAKLFLTEIGAWSSSQTIPLYTDSGVITRQIYDASVKIGDSTDSLDGIRHDFGDMPVYTIDDASAHELDDGISIERTNQGTWLHIHIANPSAFVSPESHIAKLARIRQTSVYMPDQMFPMLPLNDETVKSKGFSKDSSFMPTMTFSARLSEDGSIIDFQVRPGIVRNVKVLTYDDVDNSVFGEQKPVPKAWWTGGFSKKDYLALGKEFDAVSPEIKADLLAIEETVQKHREWRERHGALTIEFPNSVLTVNPGPIQVELFQNGAPLAQDAIPAFVRGQVGVQISLTNFRAGSRRLIEEMMIIAGRVAGLFSREHGLPVAYRGLTTNITPELLERIRSQTTSSFAFSRELLASGAWQLQQSSSPQDHQLLGIPAEEGGYVQVTSPMRRYLDMLAHWQFGAHLTNAKLPFTQEQLSGTGEYSLFQASRRLFRRIFFSRQVSQFYKAQAVAQLLSNPGGIGSTHLQWSDGKPKLTGFLLEHLIEGTTYTIPRVIGVKELGVHGLLFLRPDERAPDFDEEFGVEIEHVKEVEGSIMFRLKK